MMNISNTYLLNKLLFYNFIHIDKEFFKQLYSSMKLPSIDSHIFPKSLTALLVWICVMYCNYIIKWYSFHCSPAPVCVLSALLSLGLGSTCEWLSWVDFSHFMLFGLEPPSKQICSWVHISDVHWVARRSIPNFGA